MANPVTVSVQLVAAITNGVCLSQTPAAAGLLTMNGSLVTGGVATFDVARRVGITSAGNDSTVVFTVTGTNRWGNTITDTATGANGAVVAQTALDFLTVTSIRSSAATANAITAGTSGVGSSEWQACDTMVPFWALSVAVSVSGAVTYTVEHTYDDPNKLGTTLIAPPQQFSLEGQSNSPPIAWPNPSLIGKNTSGEAQYANQPIFAYRVTVTAGTGRATLQAIQVGLFH
jgi:hypothetical protein